MRRPRRSIEIFSISAIDLFAGAMGAFALIAILLFPSYLKISKAQADVDRLGQTAEQLKRENQSLREQLEAMRTTVFLGLVSKANSFVLLIDMSGSMTQYAALMKRTVLDMIAKLRDDQMMHIIGFQGESPTVQLPQWQNRPAPATAANKKSALAYVDSITTKFDGGTPTFEALSKALSVDAEAIILLSDGAPNTDRTTDSIISEITAINGGKKIIYAVALGDYDLQTEFAAFMQGIARANKGDYIGISK